MLDSSELIYLGARYYAPENANFAQIDTNYDGEKDNIVSQNRYTYTINNPYKYVDRNGNIFDTGGIISPICIYPEPIIRRKPIRGKLVK